MAQVRAKFRVTRIETSIYHTSKKTSDNTWEAEKREMRTVVMSPVSGDGAPENKAFWDASPSGELRLGTVNPEAWKHFELNCEYYIDFTKAEG